MSWKAWTAGTVGLWLIVSAFLRLGAEAHVWNDVIVGVVAIVTGFGLTWTKPWQGWGSSFLGIWLVVAAFVPALTAGRGLLWNNTVVGTAIALSGFTALRRSRSARSLDPDPERSRRR